MALKVGTFECIVLSHALVTVGKNETPAWKFVVAIPEIEVDDIAGTIWLTPKSLDMARSQLKSLGFDVDKDDMNAVDLAQGLAGHKTVVELKEDVWEGKTAIKVYRFGRGDGTGPRPSAQILSAIQAKLRAAKDAKPDVEAAFAEKPPF